MKRTLKIAAVTVILLILSPFVLIELIKVLPDCTVVNADFSGKVHNTQSCECKGYEINASYMHTTRTKCIGYVSEVMQN